MSPKRIHHVQITVPPDLVAKARQFYCGVFGFNEIDKPASLADRGGFWVAVGDQQLHIGVEDHIDREATKAHVAYEVDDLAAWRKRLDDAGLDTIDSISIPGFDRFECRDPFGNRIEFIMAAPRPT